MYLSVVSVPIDGAKAVERGPAAHVLRLFLRPRHLFDVRLLIDELTDLTRPRRELLDANHRDVGRPLRHRQLVVHMPAAEHEALHGLAML